MPGWSFEARRTLEDAIDGLNAAVTHYAYQVSDIRAVPGELVKSLLVRESRAPEGGITQYLWDTTALTERVEASHRVIDREGDETEYRFNNYGSALEITDPLGHKTEMEWDPQDVRMTRREDGNGSVADYTYDEHGNVLTETIWVTDFDGAEHVYTTTNTYLPADQPPFQSDLLASRTDRNGNTTTFTYDAKGNLLSQSIEVTDASGETTAVATHHTYSTNGDRLTATDPRGEVTTFRYDNNGYVDQVTDPLGHVTRTVWDERGQPLEITDPLGRKTFMDYDDRGRLTRRLYPDEALELVSYFDGLNLRIETDPLGRTTRTTTDDEGRVVLIENALGGQKVYEYDQEGRKVLESRWFDGTTPRDDIVFTYDEAGRLVERRETHGVTTFTYDAVGNLISERLISETDEDFVPRLTETDYDELNRPIAVRRQLGEGWVTTRQKLDGEGNKLLEVDPLGRTMLFDYDELNRLIRSEESATRVRRSYYDAAGNRVRSELDNTVDRELSTQVRAFVYDAAGRMTAEVDALGHPRVMEYDAAGNVVRELDRRGHLTSHAYDVRNRRIRTTLHLDRVTEPSREVVSEFRYDRAGNLIGETLTNGNERTHVYDNLNRLTSTTDSLGPVASYAYDARGNRLRETDANGNETVNAYDVYDRLIHQQLPEDREVSFVYDAAGNRVSETNARGLTTTNRFDNLDRLIEVTDALEQISTLDYDAAGNKIRETNRRGHATDFEYDDLNRLVLRTAPEVDGERYTATFAYDPADNLISEVDRRGILTEHRYDLENRRTHSSRSGLLIEQVEYDAEGNAVLRTDANGNQATLDYDERGLLIAEHRPLEATTTFEFDDMGDRLRAVDPEGKEVVWTYDLRRRVETEASGGGAETTTFGYDGNGNRISMQRPEGGEWTYELDGADRLAAVVNPESDRTEYTYDKNGNLEAQTDGEQNTTSYSYDELDRQASMTYPDSAVETRGYDPENNLIEVVDPKGQVATFTYDALARETLREYRETAATLDPAEAVASTWDANNNLLTTVESSRGVADETTSRSYDTFDRLESITDRWGNTLSYAYDANGNRTRLTDPDGVITTYTYDALNRVSSVVIPGAGATQYTYFKNSRLRQVSYPNGTTADYTYDDSNRVATIDNRHTSDPVSSFEYTYDLNGNRTQQIETHGGPAETTGYRYDDADRLITVTYPDKVTTYTYDSAGNRLSETDTDLPGDTVLSDKSYIYNSRNQLTDLIDLLDSAASVTYSYDANGNRISRTTDSGEATGLTYDLRNRLITVDQDGISQGTYGYDFQGLRISKQTAESGLERYVYDDQSPLLRTRESGRTTKYEYGPNQLLSVDDSDEGRAYYVFDALGSVSELTTPAGEVIASYLWDAWGNKRSSVETESNPFGFTGHEHDDETGLVYAKARFYDPEAGIFLSQDPVFGDPANPPSLHRYLYAFQNPTVYVDPTGKVAELVALAEIFGDNKELLLKIADSLDDDADTQSVVEAVVDQQLASLIGKVAATQGFGKSSTRTLNALVNASLIYARLQGTDNGRLTDDAFTETLGALKSLANLASTVREDPRKAGTLLVSSAVEYARSSALTLLKAQVGDTGSIAKVTSASTELALDLLAGGGIAAGANRTFTVARELIALGDDLASAAGGGIRRGARESVDELVPEFDLNQIGLGEDFAGGIKRLTAHSRAHTLTRHGRVVTDEQLVIRARTGVAPDGHVKIGKHGDAILPPVSSAFHSDELAVRAERILREGPLQDAIAAYPTRTVHTVNGEIGANVGRGYSRIGSSRFRGRHGPLQFHPDMSRARGTFELDPSTGEWNPITLFPDL